MKKRILCLLLCLSLVALFLTSCGGEQTETAPDFTVYQADEKSVRLSDMRGKPTVVNFWATWCPPCVYELPHFQEAIDTYGDDVNFMMINVDGNGKTDIPTAQTFMAENGYSFPVYFDLSYEASITYGVNAIPMTLWLDAKGQLVHSYNSMLTEEYLVHYIEEIIK